MNRPDEFQARQRYACFLGKLAVALFVAWLVLVLVAGCAPFAPPPSCDLSANPELCRLERRLAQIEFEARQRENLRRSDDFMRDAKDSARRTCEHAHGAGSQLCN